MQRPSLKIAVRALAYRDYRLFFTGQAISLIGTWMTRLASSWMVYRLTKDPFMLGLVNFAGLVPSFVLGPIAGVAVDRSRDLKRLIYRTQLAGMFQSFGLVAAATLPLQATVAVYLLIALNFIQGLINAFDMPARQAFLPRMVTGKEDLANGIALNSMLFNGARLVGPAVAGGLIAVIGEAGCFGIDAVSYVGVLWALKAMKVPQTGDAPGAETKLWDGLRHGISYAFHSPSIRALLGLVATLSFFGMPYTVLLPVYAKEVLGGGPTTLGWLTASSGLGAIVGAVLLAGRTSNEGIGRVIIVAGVVFSLSLFGFAYSTILGLSMALMLGTGFGMLRQSTSCNTVIQTIVEPGMRGRVMSLYAMAFVGVAPFGSLAAGYAASRIGAPNTLAACAVLCGGSTLYFAWRLPAIRRTAAAAHVAPASA